MNYVESIRKANTIEIHYVSGESLNDIPIYAYIALPANLAKNLNLSLLLKNTKLENYGVVLFSGEGEPTPEIKMLIKQYLNEL